ncbi:MAG: hypothetical protein LBV56_24705 [Delftia acidovorans]|jgi:hypothetical protein|nr:hypothetical protein [Delftia acidovorans]
MDHKQLELEFDVEGDTAGGAHVVEFNAFMLAREARERRKSEQEQAVLIAEILKSVEHITGRSPEAEAM